MRNTQTYCVSLLICFLLFVGCQKPGPIELQDQQGSGVDSVQSIMPSAALGGGTDTTGLLRSDQTSYAGLLLVTGVRYDLPAESHTVSLARAFLLDKSQPVIHDGTTVGFRALDIGSTLIDGLPLYRVPYHVRFVSGGSIVDTIAGIQYGLANMDGVGGRGFTYAPGHSYEWTNIGGGSVQLSVQAASARGIIVQTPRAGDVILQREGMAVGWSGGERLVRLIISGVEAGRAPIPLLRMTIWSNVNRVRIPEKVLRLLPNNRFNWFVLTFVSERRAESQVQGFPDKVLVYSASIHNVFVRIRP